MVWRIWSSRTVARASVSIEPGAMAFTLILGDRSLAMRRVIWSTAALAVA